jgi:hypothetical protein
MREGLLLHLLQVAGGKPTFPMVKEVMDYKLLKMNAIARGMAKMQI